MKHIFIIILSFLVFFSVKAQDKKALRYFNEGWYEEVVKYYQAKHLEKEDAVLLTKSLLQLGDNERALLISSKLFNEKPGDEQALLNYYSALTFDRQYKLAYEIIDNKKEVLRPGIRDSVVRDSEKFMIWEYDKRDIEVKPLDQINTPESEYSPIPYNGRLYYCVLNTSGMLEKDVYDIREGKLTQDEEIKKDKEKPFTLSGFKSSRHANLGPFCVYENHIYYTISNKNYKGLNNLKIIQAQIDEKGKIKEEKELSFCDKSYSVAHPTISEDGSKLFFSSDMPGGYGQMDLYVSYRTPGGWGTPINLGGWVNTRGNELFPFYSEGSVYFSSDGLDGYGGLDIFEVIDDDRMETVDNLKYPINTPFDDFGICITGEDKGYFSSNRPMGAGGDDVYSFRSTIIEEVPKITGIMTQKGVVLANKKVQLVDMDGNVLEETVTDENGAFVFNRQPEPGRYGIKLAEPLENNSNIRLSLTDQAGNITENLAMNDKGVFVFEMFALDEVDELSMFSLYETDPYELQLFGVVYRDMPGDLHQIFNIEIQDEDYNELQYLKTDENAKFVADDLPYGERFLMQIETGEKDLKMAVVDEYGAVIQELYSPGNNLFAYQHIGNPADLISIVDNNKSTSFVMKNQSIKIPNIYYDYDSYKLNAKSKKSLNELAETLKNNKTLKIKLMSHTDTRGTASSNKLLSEKRAGEAKRYLVRKGIASSRIIAKGYGWDKLLINCWDIECSEEDHAQNRRTEFEILSN